MADGEDQPVDQGSAADLLSAWRAAERDHAAAIESATVAELAASAADRAAHAARETADAAKLSLQAAERAERAARETADAADSVKTAAARDQTKAVSAVADSLAREAAAKEAFQDAQRRGFPKPRS